MGPKSTDHRSSPSAVEILRAHIGELPIRHLDDDWISSNKVDLSSIMEDKDPGIRSRLFFRDD